MSPTSETIHPSHLGPPFSLESDVSLYVFCLVCMFALLWFLVGETMLGSYGIRWLQPFTPAGATAAIAHDRSLAGLLPPWAGVLLLLGYAGVLLWIGGTRLQRRSIT